MVLQLSGDIMGGKDYDTFTGEIKKLVDEGHVEDWDDPRMPTVAGMRRRGYTPAAIRDFCARIGITKSEGTVEMGVLENSIRTHLDAVAPRRMAVLDPLKVVTTLHGTDITLVGNDPSYAPLTRYAIAASDAVTAVSEDLRLRTTDNFEGVPSCGIEVIPNFVDTERVHPMPRQTSYREEYGLGDATVVMYAGNDRRSGRVYKFVTDNNYMTGMTTADTRALLDQLDRGLMQSIEVVRRMGQPVLPVESQPPDVLLNRFDILRLLARRVGVVVPEVALAAVLLGHPEVDEYRLGAADVDVAVRLGRKASNDPSTLRRRGEVVGAVRHQANARARGEQQQPGGL